MTDSNKWCGEAARGRPRPWLGSPRASQKNDQEGQSPCGCCSAAAATTATETVAAPSVAVAMASAAAPQQKAAASATARPSPHAHPAPSAAPARAGHAGEGKKTKTRKKGPPLRRGKWTPEEEAYANRLIQEFRAGLLPLADGTTLRTFLSKLLKCDPMRISKKFAGSNCIGKQEFRRRTADVGRLTPEQIRQSRAELSELERRFLERVAQKEKNSAKSSGVRRKRIEDDSEPRKTVASERAKSSTDPVKEPGEHDVVMGRGGMAIFHIGNQRFRSMAKELKPAYVGMRNDKKTGVSKRLVQMVHDKGGEFLVKDESSGVWRPVDFKQARRKASQALRRAEIRYERAKKKRTVQYSYV